MDSAIFIRTDSILRSFLGYDRGKDGGLVINRKQARTVRYIFQRFLEGRAPYGIAQELMERKMPTGTGNLNWTNEGVVRILRNEKYCGNVILQKSYKKDLLSRRRPNNGEVKKYFIEHAHEPIVTVEQFNMVQQELEVRSKGLRSHSSKTIYSSRIVCGCCGGFYGSKVWHSTGPNRKVVWQCNNKYSKKPNKGTGCKTQHLVEEQIKEIFLEALNKLVSDRTPAMETMKRIKRKLEDETKIKRELLEAEEACDKAAVLFQDYVGRNALTESDVIDGKFIELETKYVECNEKRERLHGELTERKRRASALDLFMKEFSKCENIFPEFNEKQWLTLLDRLIVNLDRTVTVRFKGGYEIVVALDRKKNG